MTILEYVKRYTDNLTITKKESLFLSVYHTVWMLHKAKTARLDNIVPTYYRQVTDILPTHHQLSADCRSFVGRLIVYVLGKPCRPSVGQQTADSRPTVGRQTADSRPTDDRQSADRFFGELFFTITQFRMKNYYILWHNNVLGSRS